MRISPWTLWNIYPNIVYRIGIFKNSFIHFFKGSSRNFFKDFKDFSTNFCRNFSRIYSVISQWIFLKFFKGFLYEFPHLQCRNVSKNAQQHPNIHSRITLEISNRNICMTSIRNHSRITEISPWNRSKALKTPPTIVSEFVSSILSEIPPKISLDFFSMIALAISESLFHELLEGFLLEFLHKIFQEFLKELFWKLHREIFHSLV